MEALEIIILKSSDSGGFSCPENNKPRLGHSDRGSLDGDLNDALFLIFQLLVKLYRLQMHFLRLAASFSQ